ncbi:glycoside hydrolase family 32 protein [Leuconostoc mesenteroides]|uniref:glycoside hydrolase family 32 protein n=1 Tax=Leuconostoc mesenteroides TaxID=1245 RepID=UPI00123BDD4B|nr:glycoside hydrolase family 32 protein [Leuconostoc mesenteroides]KAA8348750.1 glycoside hydrolase family 32 protein [Leuconostoc mesenteroides]
MAFTPKIWQPNDEITSAHLNRIEKGIANGNNSASTVEANTFTELQTFSAGANGNLNGNAATSTRLKEPVMINGTNFDGSSNLEIHAPSINTLFDKYSNNFHFQMPDVGFMNDIQSAFYRNGLWHLYFLYNADSRLDSDGNQTGGNGTEWYHVTTADWVKWNYEGVAIHKYKTNWGDVATGTIFEDVGNYFGKGQNTLIALATGYGGDKGQNTMAYYSTDNGYNFTALQSEPVLKNGQPDGTYPDFRDPFLFHMDNKWIMYMAEGAKFGVYVSDNPTSGYAYKGSYNAPNSLLECPNLFVMNIDGDKNNQKWVLFYGGNGGDETSTGTFASVGHLDNNYVFVPEQENIRIDRGPDFYGSKVFADTSVSDVNDHVLSVGWVGNWGYSTMVPNDGRMGNGSLTRSIKLHKTDNNYWFSNDILGIVQDYLDNPIIGNNLTSNIALPMFKGDAFYFKLRLKDMSNYKGKAGVEFYGNGYDAEFTFDFSAMTCTVVHRYCSDFTKNAAFSKDRVFPIFMSNMTDVWLEFYVDRTTIEHLTADRQVYTMAKYPRGRSRERIAITSSTDIKFDYEYYQIINERRD